MKKHMLKETNSMRRLMGLELLKEDAPKPDSGGVMGAEWVPDGELDKTNIDEEDDTLQEGKESLPTKEDIEKCVSEGKSLKTICEEYGCKEEDIKEMYDKCKSMNEDSEGEETYNYGEDEGADEHREDEMEDEKHHMEEDMAPHDRIKAIEEHLDALKKDMGYDEDHEDRDEEGTHFAEGKRYSKVLNTLTESQYRKLKSFINEGEIIVPISKKDMRQRRRAERKERRDDKRMARKDRRGDATPEEITDFIKNGGSIYNSSNKEVTGDGTNGYKFQSVQSDGRVVLGWRKGEGLALVIDPENKSWEIYERGGMSDRWSVTSDGSFLFSGEKIKLS